MFTVMGGDAMLGWDELGEMRFTPAQAQMITGVSRDLQRKWAQLHFGFDVHHNSHFDVSTGGHRRFTFSGIQRLAFFRDISGDIGTRFGVGPVREAAQRGARVFEEATVSVTHSDLFGVDVRDRGIGDLFIFCSLVEKPIGQFTTASAEGLAKILPTEWGARLYIYNVSLMQRTVAEVVRSLQSSKKFLG